MIQVSIYKNVDRRITGFKLLGHAEYSEKGSDIVCSAVSALVINTINSIEKFTSDRFELKQDEDKGLIEFQVIEPVSENTSLLLKSLILGLQGIEDQYTRKYIKIY
mgnify:CR=1 FL=1